MHGLNYEGLKKRETYDEIIDYLMNKQEKIKMPNRLAKQLRESPQLSNLLDGDGEGAVDIEQQQRRAALEVERVQRIRETAGPDTGGPTEQRTFQPPPPPPFNPQSRSTSSQTQFPKANQEVQATRAGPMVFNKETQARPTLRRERQESTTYIPDGSFQGATPEFMANLQGFVNDVEGFVSTAAAREQQQNENIRRMVAKHLQEETPRIPYLENIGKETRERRRRSRSPTLKPVQETMELDGPRPVDPVNPRARGRPRQRPQQPPSAAAADPKQEAPPKKPTPQRPRSRSPKGKQKPRVIAPKALAAAKPPAKPSPAPMLNPPPPPKRSQSESMVKADAPPKRSKSESMVKADAPPKRSKSEAPAVIQRRRSKLENLFSPKPSAAPAVEPPRPKPSTAPRRRTLK